MIDKSAVGTHASGKNPGNINPILACSEALQPFAMESFHRHQSLALELAKINQQIYKLEPVRRLMMSFNDEDKQELDLIAGQFNQTKGFKARWLDQSQIKKIDHRISSEIPSALLLEGNFSLDSLKYNQALIAGAKHNNAVFICASVTGISQKSHGYEISTNHGVISADVIVLATGSLVQDCSNWLGFNIPIRPVKGEMLRLQLKDKNITHDLTHGLISLYRRGDNELWLGVTREDMVSDEKPTNAAKIKLLEGAKRILPVIEDAILIEHLASIRPMARGGLPIIDEFPGYKNIFIANGGGIKGVLTSAGLGMALRDLIMTGASTLSIKDFKLSH